jgi:hypothetical protein
MSDLGLRPRSSTELVDAAFQLYRREPLQFIIGLSCIYVPWMLVMASLGIQNDPQAVPTFSQLAITSIGGIVVYTLATGVTTVLASEIYFGRSPDLAGAFRAVISNFAPLMITMFAAGIAIAVGFIFLILPAFYFYARYFALKQAILIEGLGVNGALRRTAELSKGTKRHILNTMLLMALVTTAISIGVTLLSTMIPSFILRLLISTALSAVVYPMWGITETLLYYDIRIRKEGFDIEYMANMVEEAPLAT